MRTFLSYLSLFILSFIEIGLWSCVIIELVASLPDQGLILNKWTFEGLFPLMIGIRFLDRTLWLNRVEYITLFFASQVLVMVGVYAVWAFGSWRCHDSKRSRGWQGQTRLS